MKKISLGRNRVTYIDDKVEVYASLFKWRAMKYPSGYYCVTSLPRFLNFKVKNVMLHHFVMYWVYGHRRIIGRDIDHIDGNPLNNLKSNLRFVTSSKNNANKRKYGLTSKYKGVYLQKKPPGWIAQICRDKKYFYLGKFTNEIDAAKAYDSKAKELFGEYAKLNFSETRKKK